MRFLHSCCFPSTQGFLYKTKPLAVGSSTKLRLFALKREPESNKHVLEYYEGQSLRGSIAISQSCKVVGERVTGTFELKTPARTYYLKTEHAEYPEDYDRWVYTLEKAAASFVY